jgi:hypothetical protein
MSEKIGDEQVGVIVPEDNENDADTEETSSEGMDVGSDLDIRSYPLTHSDEPNAQNNSTANNTSNAQNHSITSDTGPIIRTNRSPPGNDPNTSIGSQFVSVDRDIHLFRFFSS